MVRHEMQELLDMHTEMQQTIADMRGCRDELAVAQAANAGYKKRIAEQDACAVRMDAEQTKYMENVNRSFLSLQADMQVFMDLSAEAAAERMSAANTARDSYKQSLANQDALHVESVRALNESCDGKLTLADELCKKTCAELQLARQEVQDLLAFCSKTPSDMDVPDLWSEDEDIALSQESIDAFIAGSRLEHDDADNGVFAQAACGQQHVAQDFPGAAGLCEFEQQALAYPCSGSVSGGVCGFELQALAYPCIGAGPVTSQTAHQPPGQRSSWKPRPHTRPQQSALPCLCLVLCLCLMHILTRNTTHAEAFKFQIGDRVTSKNGNRYYKWPGDVFGRHAAEDGTATYSVSFDDGDVAAAIKERFLTKQPPAPRRPVSILEPLAGCDVVRSFPGRA